MSLITVPEFWWPDFQTVPSGTQRASLTVGVANARGGFVFRAPKSGELKYVYCQFETADTESCTLSVQTVDASGFPTGTLQDASCAGISVVPTTTNRYDLSNAGAQATCTVTVGDLIAVVFTNPASGFPVFVTRGWRTAVQVNRGPLFGVLYNGTTWSKAVTEFPPSFAIEYDDGIVAPSENAIFAPTITATAFNSGSASNVRAMKFTPAAPMRVVALAAWVDADANLTMKIVNAAGTTQGGTGAVTSGGRAGTGAEHLVAWLSSPAKLAAGTPYYACVVPDSVTNVVLSQVDVNTALTGDSRLMGQLPGGTAAILSVCASSSWSWTDTVSSWPGIALLIDQIDNGRSPRAAHQMFGG